MYETNVLIVGAGKNQIYGTQIVSGPNGKLMLHPVDDPANVDERGKAVGLRRLTSISSMEKRNLG